MLLVNTQDRRLLKSNEHPRGQRSCRN